MQTNGGQVMTDHVHCRGLGSFFIIQCDSFVFAMLGLWFTDNLYWKDIVVFVTKSRTNVFYRLLTNHVSYYRVTAFRATDGSQQYNIPFSPARCHSAAKLQHRILILMEKRRQSTLRKK